MKYLTSPVPPSSLPPRTGRRSCHWVKYLAAPVIASFMANSALAAPSTTIVISQIYGGGGNSGAPYTHDFVELHNISGGAVDVTNWSVQYAGPTSAPLSWSSTTLSGSIPSGGYYLVQLSSAAAVGSPLPTPDATGTTALGAAGGKIALSNTSAALSGSNPIAGGTIVDFVGYGTSADAFEGTGSTAVTSATKSALRKNFGSQDTDDNSVDFETGTVGTGAFVPRNSSSGTYLPPSDITPPGIASLTPANGAFGISTSTSISTTFDEPVAAGAGAFHLYKKAGAVDVEIAIGAVDITDNTASFTPSVPLEGGELYYVLIDSTAITDLAVPPNAFPGVSSQTTWSFITAGGSPPTTGSISPLDDSLDVLPTSNFSITYDKNVFAGSGTILIRKSSDDSIVASMMVPSAQVTVSGTNATINPTIGLDYSTSYYVEVPAGAFQDVAANPAPAISGNAAWNFTTRAAPSVAISQYYEGSGNNKYIELHNLTGSPLDLTGYRLAVWSTSDSPGNQAWKTGVDVTTRVSVLDGETIPANGYFLIGDNSATGPGYAANNTDLWLSYPSGVSFAGVGSVVLYSSATNDLDSVVDAVSVTSTEGTDTSFHRLNNGTGFDFSAGSSILDYTAVWGTKTVAQVDAALVSEDWYLQASTPPVALTLAISPTSISESAGDAATTATVTRDGATDADLEVFLTVSDSTEAHVQYSVTIPSGSSDATFPIDAVDDLYLDGDQQVTVTVSSFGFSPASQEITITDDLTDAVFPVVINEVDSDQTSTDTGEFIELYNNSGSEVSLDDVVLVFYNGTDDLSYYSVDLTGKVIAPNGFFVVGNSAVTSASITFANGKLQNGADAVALYIGSAADFPTDTPVSTTHGTLVDAVVYGSGTADAGLIAALAPGMPQVSEDANAASATESMSRLPDGGAAFDTTLYVAQTPTPGITNVIPSNDLAAWISGFSVGTETGVNGDFDNDGLDNAIENILGSNPSLSNTGMTGVSSTANSVTFRHTLSATPASDLTAAYEWSRDLVAWHPGGGSDGVVTVSFSAPSVVAVGPPDLVEVTATADGAVGTLFARLKVSNP